MRLDRLGLIRYGRFTDHEIDFGPRPESGPDLHLIYGPNEAGKSTTLAAWLDLLYGIGAKSGYSFLHPFNTMRIEGTISLGGVPRSFTRIGRLQLGLLDGDDQPVADAAIQTEVGGIGREAHRTMFSLDEETLEAGAKSILASRGDLGQLLFSASAGLVALGSKLDALKIEADAFFKPLGRKTEFAELIARDKELKVERDTIDMLATDHRRLVEQHGAAAAAYAATVAEHGDIRMRLARVVRQLEALPRLDRLRALRVRLAAFGPLPEPPPDWPDRLAELRDAAIALATRRALAEDAAARTARDLDAIRLDDAAARLATRFAGLDGLASRHHSAEGDLPTRRLERDDARRIVAEQLRRLGRADEADPASLLIATADRERLLALVERRSGIEAELAGAAREVRDAADLLVKAEADAAEAGGGPSIEAERLAAIAALLARLREEDLERRWQRAQRERAEAAAAEAERRAELAPWSGDSDALAAMPAPDPAEIVGWQAALQTAAHDVTQYRSDVDRLTTAMRRAEAELSTLSALAGPVTEGEVATARARRETAWADHRRRLDVGSAEAFEAAMRQDDITQAARLAAAHDTARRARLAVDTATAQVELARAGELLAAAEARLRAEEDRIAARMERIAPGLLAALTMGGLGGWIMRRGRALDARATLRAAMVESDAAGAAVRNMRETLAGLLAGAGISEATGESLGDLAARATMLVEAAAQRAGLARMIDERRRAVEARGRALAEAKTKDADWWTAWRAALAASWLGAVDPPPGALREILDALEVMGKALEKAAGFDHRIVAMEKDQALYRAALADLAAPLGMAATDAPAVLADRLGRRIEAARAAEAAHARLTDESSTHQDALAAIAAEQAVQASVSDAMTGFFDVASLDDVAGRLKAVAERRELARQAAELERDIVEPLGVGGIDEVERLLDAVDADTLEAQKAELEQRAEDLGRRSHERYAEMSRAAERIEAIGGDDAVARIEARRRTVMVEIADGAMKHLRLRAGTAAAEVAIRLYRERHRSAMMQRASDAFRMISRGAYAGLAAQPGKDGETLIAVAASGGSKAADELSKGTRFQLYLALRVAGYHEFVAGRPPIPFIADDIMESFDDFRAEEAFRLFAGMAETGQVIYLTHHRHLVPIVRAVCPQVRVHALDPADSP